MVDKDVVEDFEEEEPLLAHADANQGWEIDIDTLVDRVAGVATRSYEERLPRDSPHIAGEFFPVNSNAVIVEALLLVIQETCVNLVGPVGVRGVLEARASLGVLGVKLA